MTRNEIQEKAVKTYKDGGIWYLCPRFGKVKTTFLLCEKNGWDKIKVLAPRKDIFESWKNDKEKFGFKGRIEFETFTSLHKMIHNVYDLVVIDEIHEASDKQLQQLANIVNFCKSLGLSGTMTRKTEENIYFSTGMEVCHKYTIAQGIEDGILADYEIKIHSVELSGKPTISTNKGTISEAKRYSQLLWKRNMLKNNKKPYFFVDLAIINLLQNSEAKKQKTIQLLNKYDDERILVFCGTTETADDLGIPSYHSKTKEKTILDSFCKGEGKHMATIRMMQSGITILPISKGIINYMSGNPEDSAQKICRFLGIEYDNLSKKADIHIICTNTEFEKERLKTALMFFDNEKIKYL